MFVFYMVLGAFIYWALSLKPVRLPKPTRCCGSKCKRPAMYCEEHIPVRALETHVHTRSAKQMSGTLY